MLNNILLNKEQPNTGAKTQNFLNKLGIDTQGITENNVSKEKKFSSLLQNILIKENEKLPTEPVLENTQNNDNILLRELVSLNIKSENFIPENIIKPNQIIINGMEKTYVKQELVSLNQLKPDLTQIIKMGNENNLNIKSIDVQTILDNTTVLENTEKIQIQKPVQKNKTAHLTTELLVTQQNINTKSVKQPINKTETQSPVVSAVKIEQIDNNLENKSQGQNNDNPNVINTTKVFVKSNEILTVNEKPIVEKSVSQNKIEKNQNEVVEPVMYRQTTTTISPKTNEIVKNNTIKSSLLNQIIEKQNNIVTTPTPTQQINSAPMPTITQTNISTNTREHILFGIQNKQTNGVIQTHNLVVNDTKTINDDTELEIESFLTEAGDVETDILKTDTKEQNHVEKKSSLLEKFKTQTHTTDYDSLINDDGINNKEIKFTFQLKDLENKQTLQTKLINEMSKTISENTPTTVGKTQEIRITMEPKSLGRMEIVLNNKDNNLDISIKVSNKGVEHILTESLLSLKDKIEKNTSINMNSINIYIDATNKQDNNLQYRRVEENYQQNGNTNHQQNQGGGGHGRRGQNNQENLDFQTLQQELLEETL